MLVLSICSMALMLELVFEGQRNVRGKSSKWNLWRMEALLLRICYEGIADISYISGNSTGCSFSAGLKVSADQWLDLWLPLALAVFETESGKQSRPHEVIMSDRASNIKN